MHAARVPADSRDSLDILGTAVLSFDRLRAFLHGPITAAERAAARRRLDELTDGYGLRRAR